MKSWYKYFFVVLAGFATRDVLFAHPSGNHPKPSPPPVVTPGGTPPAPSGPEAIGEGPRKFFPKPFPQGWEHGEIKPQVSDQLDLSVYRHIVTGKVWNLGKRASKQEVAEFRSKSLRPRTDWDLPTQAQVQKAYDQGLGSFLSQSPECSWAKTGTAIEAITLDASGANSNCQMFLVWSSH